jgi:parallel beta-helix repeat protein
MRIGGWRQLLKRIVPRSLPKTRRPRRSVTLALEILEDRTAPALFTVVNTGDVGAGSGNTGDLLYCVNQANLTTGSNTIQFDLSSGPQTIALTNPLVVSGTVTIDAGLAPIALSGGNTSQIFIVTGTATLDNLTLTDGYAQFGGAINNSGNLTLSGCTLSNNEAYGGDGASPSNSSGGAGGGGAGLGGAIYNTGTLALINCTLADNLAIGGQGGSFSTNFPNVNGGNGGGSAGGAGGAGSTGANNASDGSAGLFGSGGGGGGGTYGVNDSPLAGNGGAGGFGGGGGGAGGSAFGGPGGTVGLGGTYAGNGANAISSGSGAGGGGAGLGGALFIESGTVTLTNCTIASNSATGGAGGTAYINGSAGDGVGGGIFINGGTVTANNTILSGNTSSTSNADENQPISGIDNLVGGSADLGLLQNNGGPTSTMAPEGGSPAIGGGDLSLAPATDQTGQPRLGWANIGAYQNSFLVTTTADSGAGSLRQVLVNATNPALDIIITFDIPGSGVQTITPASALPLITQSIVIDGLSQPGASQASLLIALDGSNAGSVSGLTLNAGNATIEGLIISNFADNGVVSNGSDNDFFSNQINQNGQSGVLLQNGASNNVIGGATSTTANQIGGNTLAGVMISGPGTNGNVLGNNEIGSMNGYGVVVANGSSGNAIQDNNIFGNLQSGVQVSGPSTTDNTLQDNTIQMNGADGVDILNGANGNVLQDNTLVNNSQDGVLLAGAGTDANVLQGNTIGVNQQGGVVINNGASDNLIGDEDAGDANQISGSPQGVVVDGPGTVGNSIQGNSITATGGPGIILSANGNDMQSAPVLTSFIGSTVTGYLNGTAGVNYNIELFANPASGSAYQGGQFYTSTEATADSNGLVTFSVNLGAFPSGDTLTATATDLQTGDTSQFSNAPPASLAIVSGNNQQTTTGSAFANPLTVQVLDAYGNPEPGVTVTFTDPSNNITFSGSGLTDTTGEASETATAGSMSGVFPVTASLPGLSAVTFTLTVNQAPVITSADNTTFTVGSAGSFTVTTASGTYPAATFSETGALPSGVTFSSGGILSGTPAAGSGGVYSIVIDATNGVSPDSIQNFTLTVDQAPAITSDNNTTFTAGSTGSFTVMTASGTYPNATFSETGNLPVGVIFSSSGVLSGTPGPGTGGVYSIVIDATNGISPDGTQNFTLTVDQAPVITSANNTTFVVGNPGSFTVTTASGTYPAATYSETGSLPAGVTFSSGGVLSGTPAAGTSGVYNIVISASNEEDDYEGNGGATQEFTLTVGQPPVITSTNTTTFDEGMHGSFTVTIAPGAYPGVTFSEMGNLPSGVTFSSGGVLSGTPAVGTGGTYNIVIDASNGISPDATQNFTLTVFPASAPVVTIPSEVLANSTVPLTMPGSFTDPNNLTFTAVVDYGDGTGTQPLTLSANNTFTLSHIYASQGTYYGTVEVIDSFGLVGTASYRADVYLPGVVLGDVRLSTAAPGETITISATGVSATLYHSANANGNGVLLVTPVPTFVATGLAPVPTVPGETSFTSAYDLRSINLSQEDVAVVTFSYAPNALNVPTLFYFNASVGAYVPVVGSTHYPNSLVVDPATHTVRVIFDNTSMPRLNALTGTVFTITVSVPAFNNEPQLSIALTSSSGSYGFGGAGNGTSALASALTSLLSGPLGNTALTSDLGGGDDGESSPDAGKGPSMAARNVAQQVLQDLPTVLPVGSSPSDGRATLILSASQSSPYDPKEQPLPNTLPAAPMPEDSPIDDDVFLDYDAWEGVAWDVVDSVAQPGVA